MNQYKFSVDMEAATLVQWLKKNGCPKAAASVQPGTDYKSTYQLDGNVSAIQQVGVFKQLGISHKVEPIGNSEALDGVNIYVF